MRLNFLSAGVQHEGDDSHRLAAARAQQRPALLVASRESWCNPAISAIDVEHPPYIVT